CCRGRRPQRGGLGRRTPRQATLYGHPIRWKACETGAWLTSEIVHVATGGGSGFRQAHPRSPRRSAYLSEVIMSGPPWATLDLMHCGMMACQVSKSGEVSYGDTDCL